MEDRQIIELYWQRDEAAIGETDAKYGVYCFSVAQNILTNREDAEECVSDTWLRAWNTMPPQRPSYLRLFLAAITRNLSFDRYRARSAAKRGGGEVESALEELEECVPGSADPAAEVEAQELAESVNRFLRGLPQRDCDIFLRRYFYVEPPAEIAERYQLKKSHVLVLLSRTRQKLKDHLTKEGYAV